MRNLLIVFIGLVFCIEKGLAQDFGRSLSKVELQQKMIMNNPQLYKKHKTGVILSRVGRVMVIGGSVAWIAGSLVSQREVVVDKNNTTVELWMPGVVLAQVGFVSALIGTPAWITGNAVKKKTRNSYLREFRNSAIVPVQPAPYFQLNASSNGLGLALVF